MLSQFVKLFQLLDSHERKRAFALLFLVLMLGLVEVAGVASIMPFMAVVANTEIIETNFYLNKAYNALGFESQDRFLVFLGSAVFVVLVGSLLFSALTNWVIFRFMQMCNHRLSSRLLSKYLHRPYVWFLRQHSADLGKTVLNEVNQVVNAVILPAVNVLSRSVASAFLLILIVMVDPMVAFVAAAVIGGIYAAIFLSVQRYLVRIGTDMYEANSQRFKVATESLGGIKDVKVSGLEATYAARYTAFARRHAHRQATHMIISDVPRYLLEAVAFGGMLGALLFLLLTRPGGLGEVLPLIALYAFAGYRLLPALQQVYINASSLRFGSRVLDRLHMELSEQNEAEDGDGAADAANDRLPLSGCLELRSVSFSYPSAERVALDDVSIKIEANSTVGFVGTTGAGKTTLIDIILGLLAPDEGSLVVDGMVIDSSNRRRWQRALGYVPQSIFLVDDTVAANIAFGVSPDKVNMRAVESAARAAHLHEFVTTQLTHDYMTMIGERGVRLSGGQRQRIGIARALYRDPSVLVLDEATSALDNVTESVVMGAIRQLGHSKTIIIIAHRLSTVRHCDCIFLLQQGRLVAHGSYEELFEGNESFRAMAASGAA